MGYSENQIGQYFKMSGDTTVNKTHGKKAVGGINRMVMDAQYFNKKLLKQLFGHKKLVCNEKKQDI